MNNETIDRVHMSFWVIGAVALIWNLMGVINFVVQMNDAEMVAAMSATHRALIDGRPAWATAGFGVAVFGGALGCLLLLLRRPAAYYLFIASLLGVMVTMVHSLGMAGPAIDFSFSEFTMMILMPLLVAVFLILYSKHAGHRGWLAHGQPTPPG